MKKKIILGITTMGMCLSLFGCNSVETDSTSNNPETNISSKNVKNVKNSYKSEYLKDIDGSKITATQYVDESTGVHYLIVQENGRAISVTPMYNADGTLKTDK